MQKWDSGVPCTLLLHDSSISSCTFHISGHITVEVENVHACHGVLLASSVSDGHGVSLIPVIFFDLEPLIDERKNSE